MYDGRINLTFPQKIKINNNNLEDFIFQEYNLTEEENIVELFWEEDIIDCEAMFSGVNNILEINFSNFDTSKVTNMRWMFAKCQNLSSLDLSNFDTSKVIDMDFMFANSNSLASVDLSNFDTSQVITMRSMFSEGCNLVSLNLSNFDTSKVTNMEGMFAKCIHLAFVDLSSFNTSEVIDMDQMFYDCYDLVSLDLSYFITSRVNNYYRMFYSCNTLTSLNLFNFNISKNTNIQEMFYNCKILLSINLGNAIIQNEDIASELSQLPNPISMIINNETLTFLKSLNDTVDFSYEIWVKPTEEIKSTYLTLNNNTTNTTIFNYIDNINKTHNVTELLKNIRDNINYLIYSSDINNGNDLEFPEDDITITITSTENQRDEEKNKNKTTINIGNCKLKLIDEYNISITSYLYMLKLDIKNNNYKIPKIEYEIYSSLNDDNSDNLTKLNLTICQKEKVELSIPVSINKDEIDKYNSSSDYYNDICSIATSNFSTDIILTYRKNEFIDNNMTLCDENCEFIEYDYKNRKTKCSCNIKINIPFLVEDIIINKDELIKSFTDINHISNLYTIKCHKTAFNINNIKNNYGSYIILLIIILYFVCLILFYAKYYSSLELEINNYFSSLLNLNNINNNDINNNNNKINKNIKKVKRGSISNKISVKNSKKSKKTIKKNNNNKKQKRSIIIQKDIQKDSKTKIIPQKKEHKNKKENNNYNNQYNDLELNNLPY